MKTTNQKSSSADSVKSDKKAETKKADKKETPSKGSTKSVKDDKTSTKT